MSKTIPGAKRLFDMVASIALLVALFPIMATVAFLIKTKDGGNVIYGHPRIGRNGKKFNCLKFRSMAMNSDEILDRYLRLHPEIKDEWDQTRKLKNDPRVTNIGRFIRKTSLDELPQLINVLKGDMSIVGPRPVTESELDMYGSAKQHYLSVRPGLTGLWQVSGRSNTTYEERVALDKTYAESPLMVNDAKILTKTPIVVITGKGAR